MELLIGCGANHKKKLVWEGRSEWNGLVTLDMNADHKPDVVHDLDDLPYPFHDEQFDEIHAYDVLEHCGRQGDWQFFFAQWMEFHRILKPGGLFLGSSPHWSSPWVWGDPGHVRVVAPENFVFLSQKAYASQVGKTPMTDYRFCYTGDFDVLHSEITEAKQFIYVLQKVKQEQARVAA